MLWMLAGETLDWLTSATQFKGSPVLLFVGKEFAGAFICEQGLVQTAKPLNAESLPCEENRTAMNLLLESSS